MIQPTDRRAGTHSTLPWRWIILFHFVMVCIMYISMYRFAKLYFFLKYFEKPLIEYGNMSSITQSVCLYKKHLLQYYFEIFYITWFTKCLLHPLLYWFEPLQRWHRIRLWLWFKTKKSQILMIYTWFLLLWKGEWCLDGQGFGCVIWGRVKERVVLNTKRNRAKRKSLK